MAVRPQEVVLKKTKLNATLDLNKSNKIFVLKQKSKVAGQRDKILKFDKERIVIGSVISADVRLTGDGISPIHAVLEVIQDLELGNLKATLFDLASDTGIFINGKKTVMHCLEPGDRITVGRFDFTFSFEKLDDQERVRTSEGRSLFPNPHEDLTPLLLEIERDVVEIFDYRPSSKKALEVVMSWRGVILAVEHFVNEKQVTVGHTRRSHFAIPPLLSTSRYPIVTQTGGSFVLNLDDQMTGVLQKKGQLKGLDLVRNEAIKGPNGYEIPIGNSDFAKISIGEIDFYFSFTAAPPRLKRRRIFERDPLFVRILGISMLLTGAALFSLMNMTVPKSLEPEQIPARIATILYEPEKFLSPPPVPTPTHLPPIPANTLLPTPVLPPKPKPPVLEKPKVIPPIRPLPKTMPRPAVISPVLETRPVSKAAENAKAVVKPPSTRTPVANPPVVKPPAQVTRPVAPVSKAEAKEGEGARAKGKEGSRGELQAKRKSPVPVTKISRPSPQAPQTKSQGAAGKSQVPDEGNVDLLKGAGGRIQNILGNSAAHLGEGGENLKGFGNFSTTGAGGLALSGSGAGGGGNAETTLGGLGRQGTGMGRVGTGKGAAGNSNGIVGAQVRLTIQTEGPEEAVVMGSIDRGAISDAIEAHKDEFRLCYEREINAEHPTLSGKLGTSFVIGASGRVTQAGIESSSLHNPNVERCIITVLKRIDFPMPKGGGTVEVRYPFDFNSVGR